MSSAQEVRQGVNSDGKDFYIGYVLPSFNKEQVWTGGRSVAGFFNIFALISSYQGDNVVKISYFDGAGNEVASQSKVIGARNSIQVALDRTQMQLTELGDTSEFRSCHIQSRKPVSVQFISTGANSGGSYLALPTEVLGKNYVIASYNDNPRRGALFVDSAENAGGYFLIIAPYDSTNVTIIPNGLTAGGHKGMHSGNGATGNAQPYSVSLRRGECYWVKGDGSDQANDLSGSIVTASRPIAVIAGHEDAFLGSVNGHYVDGRNFMIQQMVPAEDFASSGYVSLPLKESSPSDPTSDGYGENYRVFAFDSNNVGVQAKTDAVAPVALTTTANWYPSREITNIGAPTEFHSVDGRTFSVMTYDLREQGDAAPFPAPCMMTIVPMSAWKHSYLFYVPGNTFEILQNYYIHLIGLAVDIDRGYIQYSFNGSITLAKLSTLSNQGSYTNIPYHPELKGVRYSIQPGSYYFTNTRDASVHPLSDTGIYAAPAAQITADTGLLHGAFMLYNYGMRAIDPDRDLGDLCGDDYFFSFATPVGMRLSNGSLSNISFTVDTLCAQWHICVHDQNTSFPNESGIRSVSLLNDPQGDLVRPPRVTVNAHFDPTLDPSNLGEINYAGNDSVICFDVDVSNPLDTALASLYITDNAGNYIVIDLRYKALNFMLRGVAKTTGLPDTLVSVDTLLFPTTKIGDQVCSTLVYINTGKIGDKAFTVSNVIFSNAKDSSIKISSITPSLPVILRPGDSLRVTVCFTSGDTSLHSDSLLLITDCFNVALPVVGHGGTGIIYAADIDFGSLVLGAKRCLPLTVSNVGSLAFVLTKNWLLHDTTVFSIDPASSTILPLTLPPGKSVTLTFCYSPKTEGHSDSTIIDWNTDIEAGWKDSIKSWSYLRGRGIIPAIRWDRNTYYCVADSAVMEDSVLERVNLLNASSATASVKKLLIDGQDASEFHVLTTQRGPNPFPFDMNVGDTVWVDMVFKPNLTKPYPLRYANRIARLLGLYFNPEKLAIDSAISSLIGTWATNDVSYSSGQLPFSIHPNPAFGSSVILAFDPVEGRDATVNVFDILGREVFRQPINSGDSKCEVPLMNFSNGIYYVRFTSGGRVSTEKFEVSK